MENNGGQGNPIRWVLGMRWGQLWVQVCFAFDAACSFSRLARVTIIIVIAFGAFEDYQLSVAGVCGADAECASCFASLSAL